LHIKAGAPRLGESIVEKTQHVVEVDFGEKLLGGLYVLGVHEID
jgi:hypothetical protein